MCFQVSLELAVVIERDCTGVIQRPVAEEHEAVVGVEFRSLEAGTFPHFS